MNDIWFETAHLTGKRQKLGVDQSKVRYPVYSYENYHKI